MGAACNPNVDNGGRRALKKKKKIARREDDREGKWWVSLWCSLQNARPRLRHVAHLFHAVVNQLERALAGHI